MGWGDCGQDSEGRAIGYVFPATCDHPGCKAKIDRGLSYACGGMHGKYAQGADIEVCEKYFCGGHMHHIAVPDGTGTSTSISVCGSCQKEIENIRLEAYRDMLAGMTEPAMRPADFSGVATPPAKPTAQDHRLKHIYDLLLEWDEFDGVVLDGRYMSQTDFDRVAQWRDYLAESRGRVIMGQPA